MPIVWPPELPFDWEREGYREGDPGNRLRTEMDVGAKTRRRSTARRVPYDGAIVLTRAQVATFKTFVETTLADATLPFEAVEPRTLTTKTFAFREERDAYSIAPDPGSGHWRVSLKLEALP